ncbi:MAG: hypothetical protein ACK4GN_07820 [Runella sp.]
MGYLTDNAETYLTLRTARSRKRAAIENQDKKLIRIFKEFTELNSRKRNLPMIDLIPPVQKGYKRYFVVREDVRCSKQGVFYEKLLEKINTTMYSDIKNFKKKKRYLGRYVYEVREQKLKRLSPYLFEKMKFNEQEKACFTLKIHFKVINKKVIEEAFYEMNEPWRYVLRVRPNIITKVKIFDSELEKRLDRLRKILFDSYRNYGRLCKIKGWRGSRWVRPDRYPNPLRNIPKHEIGEHFS